MALLLVVPYSTGAIGYGFVWSFFPIRSRTYLVALVTLLAVYGVAKRPRINLSIVALLALAALRILDAFFLDRAPNPENLPTLSNEGASLAYSLGIVFLSGDRIALRYSALLCGSLTILVCAGVNAWEWQNPAFFSDVQGRSAGMLVNANISAAAIVGMLGLVLAMTPPLWLAAGLICSSALGVYFTLSRGGAVVWLLIVVAYLVFAARGGLRRIVGFAFWLALILVLIIKVIDFENPLSAGTNDVSTRESVLLGQKEIEANDSRHVNVLLDGLKGVQQQPIFGYGTGASIGLYEPHNQFLSIWLDNGVVGMALFSLGLCLLVGNCILKSKVLLIGCIPLLGQIPFGQNMLEDKSYLFVWIVLGGMLQVQKETELWVLFDEHGCDVPGNEQDPEVHDTTSPALRLEVCRHSPGAFSSRRILWRLSSNAL